MDEPESWRYGANQKDISPLRVNRDLSPLKAKKKSVPKKGLALK